MHLDLHQLIILTLSLVYSFPCISILSFLFRLRGLFFKIETVIVPPKSELGASVVSRCTSFRTRYMDQCKEDILSDRRYIRMCLRLRQLICSFKVFVGNIRKCNDTVTFIWGGHWVFKVGQYNQLIVSTELKKRHETNVSLHMLCAQILATSLDFLCMIANHTIH